MIWLTIIITVLNNKINVLGADQDLIGVALQRLDFGSYFCTLLSAEVSFFQSSETAEGKSFKASLTDGVVAGIIPDWGAPENMAMNGNAKFETG